jgi:hypothetical protein
MQQLANEVKRRGGRSLAIESHSEPTEKSLHERF